MKKDFKIDLQMKFNNSDINVENSTVSIVLTDETPMLRTTWDGQVYSMVLVHDEESIDMTRADIMPAYWNHNDEGLPIGSHENVRLEDRKLKTDVVFDDEDKFAMSIFKKVQKKHIKTVSAGVHILKYETIEADDGSFTVRATKWQPYEGSFVGNPANPNARIGLSSNSEGDAINLKKEGEKQMDLKRTMEFLSTATAEDKKQIKNALGIDAEVVTLSNQVQELEIKLSAMGKPEDTIRLANESIKSIFTMVTSETFSNVPVEEKRKAIESIKLSNDGKFNDLELENVLLKSAMAKKAPSAGKQDHEEEDAFATQNKDMAGKL